MINTQKHSTQIGLCLLFFNDAATAEIYTLSLHDALPISRSSAWWMWPQTTPSTPRRRASSATDRKSTRLNSSHEWISYAVFCWKKKNIREHSLDLLEALMNLPHKILDRDAHNGQLLFRLHRDPMMLHSYPTRRSSD